LLVPSVERWKMPWITSPFTHRSAIAVMLIERNLLTGFGVIWNSGPRLPGVPGVAKLFHVAPDSVHGSVTWYRVSGSPWFWMKSTRVAFTIVELAGICPSPRPTIDGTLTRAWHTTPATSQV